jgi:hypothetical protein
MFERGLGLRFRAWTTTTFSSVDCDCVFERRLRLRLFERRLRLRLFERRLRLRSSVDYVRA